MKKALLLALSAAVPFSVVADHDHTVIDGLDFGLWPNSSALGNRLPQVVLISLLLKREPLKVRGLLPSLLSMRL